MNALEVVASRAARPFTPRRSASSFDDWASLFSAENLGLILNTTSMNATHEPVDMTFIGFAESLYLRNSVVFACLALRARLFSDARFVWQQMRNSQPGNLFGTPELGPLEDPEPGKTTGDMLTAAIIDADLAGNAFILRRENSLVRLRPDWVSIAYGSEQGPLPVWDPTAQVIGYGYQPGGPSGGKDIIAYGPEEIVHFAPTRDPLARNRGISLLMAGLREIMADQAATSMKLAYFRNSATPNLAIKLNPTWDKQKAQDWIDLLEQRNTGAANAYRTLYLAGGMEPFSVGSNMQQMTFRELQGAAETRIAALTGMHPIIAALSEGLQGASITTGNFGNAARLVGDATLRPLWRNMAASLQTVIRRPNPAARLWYIDRDVAFLREDLKDQATVVRSNMASIASAITQGFTPASSIDAITSADLTRLQHTGLVSVQLQAPGERLPGQEARMFTVSVSALRQLLLDGHTPASAVDDEIVRRALLGLAGPKYAPELSVEPMRAVCSFWPVDGPLAAYGTLSVGQTLPGDHPLVAAFPTMFTLAPRRSGPSLIVSREEVIAKRAELEASGRTAGIDRLATELGVSRDTIKRRLQSPEPTREPLAEAVTALAVAVAGRPERSVNISSPVTVNTPDIHVPPTRIEAGAVQVSVEAPKPADVNVSVEPSAVPDVNVTVEAAKAPDVNVTVEAAQAAPSVVNVTLPEAKATRRRIVRDERGQATEVIEEPTDG